MRRVDALVVGAGLAGLYALHRLRGEGLSVRVLETGDAIGGTWYWNCYPGARCDVESVDYSYSFDEGLEQEWVWTERYPAQPEILSYLNHVADRFGLRPDIQLGTRVTAAAWDDDSGSWAVTTESGQDWSARFLVLATGCLSARQIPAFPGLDSFDGECHHTADWPRDGVEVAGKRVGVIGTGSTGIQIVPELAPSAAHLYVFQRTANFSVPNGNRALEPEVLAELKARYPAYRQAARESFLGVPVVGTGKPALETPADERAQVYEERWRAGGGMPFLSSYTDLLLVREANDTIADFVRAKIRETVDDPATADLLTPRGFPLGAKRLAQDEGYFETFNRDNVTLVDVRSTPIEEITPTGLLLTDGTEYELDTIVFATGFDAITGAALRIDPRGRGGISLREVWADGPRTYLGLTVTGFPNMFVVASPASPAVLSNVVVSIEQHVDWLADAVAFMRERGLARIEPTPEAQESWTEHVAEVGDATLFPQADSWYVGANIPGKPRVLMAYLGGVAAYRKICDEVAAGGYATFTFA